MCPKCGKGAVSVTRVLASKPLGSYSVAGAQTKVVATERWMASCNYCPFSVLGHLEDAEVGPDGVFTGGHFVAEEFLSVQDQ